MSAEIKDDRNVLIQDFIALRKPAMSKGISWMTALF